MFSSRHSQLRQHFTPDGIACNSDLHTRLLLPEDQALWSALRDDVLGALPDPDCYVRERDEQEFLLDHCASGGETIGVFHRDALVAYAMLGLVAPDDPDHLGRALGMNASERGATAHLASCMVRHDWRGLGLQRALLAARLALARSHGRHLCIAAVSLHNHSSRHNMLRFGMHLAWAGDLNGLRRQITLIDLHGELSTASDDNRLIDSQDLAGQQQAFADGYVGVGEMRFPDRLCLRFERRIRGGGFSASII
ncbi:GNAT family N-acetyltransferase [Herbaspirillum sp. RV1423]|uniref:GNAT family N-acetyltransferase n=1 Tax=Herbaspirillum sp. RV1423 TaxID=1443993 RepID=UPI0018CC0B05|nr:GNAT family N-acetyltransferase [Herbaspirillum sp. RV1423]